MILAPRYIPRLAATVGLFTKYGLGDFADRAGLRALVEGEDGDGIGPSTETPLAWKCGATGSVPMDRSVSRAIFVTASASVRSTPACRTAQVTARYIAPVSR